MSISISFCIPTYKRLSTLTQAVNSILSQKNIEQIDYEILISDDGQDIETKKFVNDFQNNKIRYLENSTKGQFNNLNNLISIASNEWIVFLHDDDFLYDIYLSTIIPILLENPKVDYIWGARALMNASDHVFNTLKGRDTHASIFINSRKYFLECFTTNDYTMHGSVINPMVTGLMIKKELAARIMFDPSNPVNADALFLWKMTCSANYGLFVNYPIMCYRWLEDTERAKPSELGVVFTEAENMFYKMLKYIEGLYSAETYGLIKAEATDNFYKNAIGLDSPLLWLSLRYKGGYISRLKKNQYILSTVRKNSPNAFLDPIKLVSIFLSILPGPMLQPLYKLFLLVRQK